MRKITCQGDLDLYLKQFVNLTLAVQRLTVEINGINDEREDLARILFGKMKQGFCIVNGKVVKRLSGESVAPFRDLIEVHDVDSPTYTDDQIPLLTAKKE